ncbi:MAG: hypothetical protein H0X39_16090 [Actinobacteria bacterium]|nr:hypothetical protein [Actinomycetota bacterium]
MRLALVLAVALAFVSPALAAGTTTRTASATTRTTTTIVTTTTVTAPGALTGTSTLGAAKPRSNQQQVIALFLADARVVRWLKRYPSNPTTYASFKDGQWTVQVYSGAAGEIATGKVDDGTGAIVEAWVGPQVAWRMGRGYTGAFGGEKINSLPVWLTFCALFLIGLVDWRRVLSLRNADLLVLLSFSVSLWFFNHGHVFAAASLAYPPFAWLLLRCVWIARRDTPSRGAPVWPVWLLLAATVFAAGFRIGLNVRASNVIDVGYSGVIGADRIVRGDSPYGHFPVEEDRPKCGLPDSEGEVRDRIQTNGKCENANPLGDTYGPVSYLAYIPGYAIFGWSHQWDSLPAVHFTSILFDTICLLGLGLVGRRFGGPRLAATLAFAWVAWPFSQYASSSNTNDSIPPALLIWGFLALTSPVGRGAAVALSGWTKFASLLLVPLWSGYPDARFGRATLRYAVGFLATTALVFFVFLLEPSPFHAARVFYDRTVSFQLGRDSPFSIWDWGQYHARGLPDLHLVQRGVQVLLVCGSLALAWFPRRRSPLRMAALTGAVLIGFEVVLTHWSYLYLPWMFPFVALALVGALPGGAQREAAATFEPHVAEDDENSTLVVA